MTALSLVDIVLARRRAQQPYFVNYLFWTREIKKEAKNLLGEVRVFVFGSVIRAERTGEPARDIDVLIVSPRLQKLVEKQETRKRLWQKIGIDAPFELHLATPTEYDDWYRLIIAPDAREI